MPCYSPLQGYRSRNINTSGKRSIVFNLKAGFMDMPVKVPCGQCIGCRIDRSRQWALRCVHEASLYQKNTFITLTYNDENVPKNGSLNKKHFQDFMKRLRKEYGPNIRFYHCGEYGEKFQRPHYHACLFNFDFPDKQIWRTVRDTKYYRSQSLQDLWGYGFCTIGDVTYQSAAYVARYILKKQTGPSSYLKYVDMDYSTGEILNEKIPEYTTMSRRPGIAKSWFQQFNTDVYPSDFIIQNNKKHKPPRYYDSLFELMSPKEMAFIKSQRKLNAAKHEENNTPERLHVRKTIQELKLNKLKRSYENES